MTNNYFRANIDPLARRNPVFFFHDEDADSIESAWISACDACAEGRGHVSMWRVPLHVGAWDEAQLIGYRRRGALRHIIASQSAGPVDRAGAQVELEALEAHYAHRRGGNVVDIAAPEMDE